MQVKSGRNASGVNKDNRICLIFLGIRFGNCWCKDNKKTRSKCKYAGKSTQDCNNLFIFVPENEK